MKKLMLLVTTLPIIGFGCSIPQHDIIDQQQRQIDELTEKVEGLYQYKEVEDIGVEEKESQIIEIKKSVYSQQESSKSEDPQIKIERCKTKSEVDSDSAVLDWFSKLISENPSIEQRMLNPYTQEDIEENNGLLKHREWKKGQFYNQFYSECLAL